MNNYLSLFTLNLFFNNRLNFILKSIEEISIVAIGPLTTVATCIIADPTIGSRLNTIYVMGGNSDGEGNVTINAEFNFLFDPEAAYVVINRAKCPIVVVPWETCYRHKIDWVSQYDINQNLKQS